MVMKRVKIALKSKIKIWSYLGKLEEKFKTLIKQARRGYWGWSSGKTFSAQGPAQPQHEAPGEFTNLFHQSKFRQTSVSVCVPASGQGEQLCWTPQKPSSPNSGNSPWYRRTCFQEREHTRGISPGTQEKPAKPQLAKYSDSWTDTQRKNTGKRDQQHHWKCLPWLKFYSNF